MALARRLLNSFDGGSAIANYWAATTTTLTQPVANRAYYSPFVIEDSFTVTHLYWVNGASVSGNADMGIYDSAGVLLVSTGSQTKAGVNGVQVFNVTDTILAKGQYFWAYATNNTGHMFVANFSRTSDTALIGCRTQETAFPLPSTATMVTPAQAFYPFLGATNGASVLV